MCGIVGAVAERNVVPVLIEGLKRLEYRGYDSAGLALLNVQHHIERRRVFGKVNNLVKLLEEKPVHGTTGIAHTRWATHGAPDELNAHPHVSNDTLALVHNGIIENCDEMRAKLIAAGYKFTSKTDTEVFVHYLHQQYELLKDFRQALEATAKALHGAYAIAIICKDQPDELWLVRKGCPLVIGVGIEENFVASDKLALLPVTQKFILLEEGDIARVRKNHVAIWDMEGKPVERAVSESSLTADHVSKGEYRHFMMKEIFEQPVVAQNILMRAFDGYRLKPEPFGEDVQKLFQRAKQILIIACGTSYHAGMVAKYWFESIAKIPCQVEIASEFRYRSPVAMPDTLFITVSQSGETADTLAALRLAKKMNFAGCLAICNVAESSLSRESDATILTYAGPEIGVASTKAFTAQLMTFLLSVLSLARLRGEEVAAYKQALLTLPVLLTEVLNIDEAVRQLAHQFIQKNHALFLGRGVNFPVALEGALKLKELSYIHAEAYPAGELKHGPLALVDHEMPIIFIAPKNSLHDKLYSNAQEVKSRDGQLFILTNDPTVYESLGATISMPTVPDILEPIIYTIPLQLFAYHVAVLKGTDVDQPRNLAKSVTVE
jgi:glucosamine--fructose-6-phosphate aminotransferase (isomerizing)